MNQDVTITSLRKEIKLLRLCENMLKRNPRSRTKILKLLKQNKVSLRGGFFSLPGAEQKAEQEAGMLGVALDVVGGTVSKIGAMASGLEDGESVKVIKNTLRRVGVGNMTDVKEFFTLLTLDSRDNSVLDENAIKNALEYIKGVSTVKSFKDDEIKQAMLKGLFYKMFEYLICFKRACVEQLGIPFFNFEQEYGHHKAIIEKGVFIVIVKILKKILRSNYTTLTAGTLFHTNSSTKSEFINKCSNNQTINNITGNIKSYIKDLEKFVPDSQNIGNLKYIRKPNGSYNRRVLMKNGEFTTSISKEDLTYAEKGGD